MLSGIRVLIVKDEAPAAATLSDAVEHAGGEITPVLEALHARHTPTVVCSGTELPEKVRARHPELLALRKPVLPGRIVAEILRARGRGL